MEVASEKQSQLSPHPRGRGASVCSRRRTGILPVTRNVRAGRLDQEVVRGRTTYEETPYGVTTNGIYVQNKANLRESPSVVSAVSDRSCGIECTARRREKQSQFVSLSPGTRLCDLCASVVSPARSSEWERS